jgi:hypothetical protein
MKAYAVALVLVVVAFLTLPLTAEDYPKAEIFGGYQYLHLGNGADINASGWNASLTGNFNGWFGVSADFSGDYKTDAHTIGPIIANVDTKIYSYAGGPVVSLNSGGKINPFVQALFGGAHLSASASGAGSGSSNGFTTMVGGGADFKINRAFAFRGLADWVYYRFSGDNESHNLRVSLGIVLRF